MGKPEIIAENALDLAEHGETWPLICDRLHVKPRTLAMYLRKAGVKTPPALGKLESESRPRGACKDCGTSITATSSRCRECETLARIEQRRFYGAAAPAAKTSKEN